MNVVDALIVLFVISAIQRGLRLGLLRLILSAFGFIAGLYIGSLLAGLIGAHISSTDSRILLSLGICITTALAGASLGEIIGIRLANSVERLHLGTVNKALGAGFEAIFILFLVWVIASPLSNITNANIGRFIQNSTIASSLSRNLPPPPDLLSELGRVISSSGLPQAFVGIEPKPQTPINTAALDTDAVRAAQQSVVQIKGYGCGGIIEGSGYVAKPDIIVTNAHVVAGISQPTIVAGNKTYRATTIWFDKNTDVAILRSSRLPIAPLNTLPGTIADRTSVAIMGYPNGGPLTIRDGAIMETIGATGRNIYNRGLVTRQVYEVQGDIEPGNSGGPLVNDKGEVVGLVFAKSVSYDNVGYALTTNEYLGSLQQVSVLSPAVSTGRCAAG